MKYLLLFVIGITTVFSTLSQDSIQYSLVKNINTGPIDWPKDDGSYLYNKLSIAGGKLYFKAKSEGVGFEPWISDGTEQGTVLLKNINVNQSFGNSDDNSNPEQFRTIGNNVIFVANDHIHGNELWISDGTEIGTTLLKDIRTGDMSSDPDGLRICYDKIYFCANDGVLGEELYISDGTAQGTYMLKDICTNTELSSSPKYFYPFDGKVFFSAKDSLDTGWELWCTDGTEAGTYIVKDISTVYGGSEPMGFIEFKGELYFSAIGDSIGREVYVSDGTEQGTTLFADINQINDGCSCPWQFKILGDLMLFVASDGIHGDELWCTDGDTVYMVKDINPEPYFAGIFHGHFHVSVDDKLFFAGITEFYDNNSLWISDGTTAGTYEILTNDSSSLQGATAFVNWNNTVYFLAINQYSSKYHIWETDGTMQNTRRVFHDSLIGNGSVGSHLTLYNDEVFFSATYIDTLGPELYKMFLGPPQSVPEIDQNNTEINVFPNPFDEHFTIEVILPINATLEVMDVNGRIIHIEEFSGYRKTINIEDMQSGIYYLRIPELNHTIFKLIKAN